MHDVLHECISIYNPSILQLMQCGEKLLLMIAEDLFALNFFDVMTL